MKIAIVNDVPMAVEALRRALAGGPAARPHQLAWVAGSGEDAVRRCAEDRPDLVLMDLVMPGMDGVEATRLIMASTPCAILLVTAYAGTQQGRVFEAMGAGALDVVAPPTLAGGLSAFLAKIETIARLLGAEARLKSGANGHKAQLTSPRAPSAGRLVAIGSSAGGPAALATVLGGLTADFPASIVIVQHVDEKFAPGLAEWLNGQTPLPVRLAQPGDTPQPGVVLIAGTGDHLTFMGPTILGYTPNPADYCYRPSVDVFFESAARCWRGSILGVLLTGMGRDGANGLKTLRDKGCHTIAQDQATSAIYGMPRQAAAIGAAVEILPLDQIASALRKFAAAKAVCPTPQPALL
jgi:two-component system response regulator WspF